jgi:hypothetical protein
MSIGIRQFLGCLFFTMFFLASAVGGTPPTRPATVPPTAMWIGGPDGGVFVALQVKSSARGAYLARIFADHTGELLYQGKLVLKPPRPALTSIQDPTLFVAWDGTALLLADGRHLARQK